MNIIEEQRQQINGNNNTAQTYIDSLIQNMNKLSSDMIISEPLYGEVNLSLLAEFKIKKIVFASGSITSVSNIPDSVNHFSIGENLLIELNNLPKTIKYLDVNHNYLKIIHLEELKLLEYLNVSHNQLEELTHLPPLLMELNCSNNKLTTLNLETSKKLETLDIGYNMITTIYGYPKSIINFENTNNPSIEYIDFDEIPVETGKKVEKYDYYTSLNTYYELKSNYEKSLRKLRENAHKSKRGSKKQYRMKLKGIVAPCVYCNRNVGSIFTEDDIKMVAHCGSANDPCKFNIELIKGEYNDMRKLLNEYQDGVITAQSEIIRQKMDILFNYRNETEIVNEYQEMIDTMEIIGNEYSKLSNKYDKLHNDEEKQAMINKILLELSELKEQFLHHIQEYKETNNKEHLLSAMHLYDGRKDSIFDLKNKMHNLEYAILEVIHVTKESIVNIFTSSNVFNITKKDEKHVFNKQEHTLSNMEVCDTESSVKHFVVKD